MMTSFAFLGLEFYISAKLSFSTQVLVHLNTARFGTGNTWCAQCQPGTVSGAGKFSTCLLLSVYAH
jgi:hypothetical protein